MERVLPHRDVKEKIADLAVGLAADCDSPEAAVEALMREHLKNAQTLPFVGFVTHDGKWVGGYSGSKRPGSFLEAVEEAEQSPLLQASPAVRKKLAALLPRAEKAAEKGDWKTVMKAARDAAKTTGRCPERKSLQALVLKARAWVAQQFDTVVRVAQSNGDLTEARKALGAVRKNFSGEPEADEAALGLKAVRKLSLVKHVEANPKAPADVRQKAGKQFANTRWAALFEKPSEKKPEDGE